MAQAGNVRAPEVRMALLEERVGHCEKQLEDLAETLAQVNSKLTGVLAAVAASAVMLALNLVVHGWAP